jgi:hypothetical protein
MKSKYFPKADDIDVGDRVYLDEAYRKTNEEPYQVNVKAITEITALIENKNGIVWSVVRNRLTKDLQV